MARVEDPDGLDGSRAQAIPGCLGSPACKQRDRVLARQLCLFHASPNGPLQLEHGALLNYGAHPALHVGFGQADEDRLSRLPFLLGHQPLITRRFHSGDRDQTVSSTAQRE